MTTAIVWFRRDLRLVDNPALHAALSAHDNLVCVYIHAPEEEAPWAPGAASRWWLHHSLAALGEALEQRGTSLHIVRGPTQAALDALQRQTGAGAIFWNRLYEPALIARDNTIKARLREQGCDAHSFNANLLIEPWQVQTGQGGPYRVFTPFWRNARTRIEPRAPIPAPRRIATTSVRGGVTLESLRLLPRVGWDSEFGEHWQPGEAGARKLMGAFSSRALGAYRERRDWPGEAGTSRLSPHLHFGEIGPRQIVWTLEEHARRGGSPSSDHETFLRELGWREFAHHLLYHFPQMAQRNLDAKFDAFAWASEDVLETCWRRGRTGIPIVDAGMRQLWKSGWMHNRVRMIVASFLTKNLRRHWLHGARWFWDTLVDADLANNSQGWQWTAGSGADAAPYFRIFNPVSQALRFDPEGKYVRRWVPELAKLAAPLIHEPWKDPGMLEATGYPAPIVDLGQSRQAALAAYQALRVGAPIAGRPDRPDP